MHIALNDLWSFCFYFDRFALLICAGVAVGSADIAVSRRGLIRLCGGLSLLLSLLLLWLLSLACRLGAFLLSFALAPLGCEDGAGFTGVIIILITHSLLF